MRDCTATAYSFLEDGEITSRICIESRGEPYGIGNFPDLNSDSGEINQPSLTSMICVVIWECAGIFLFSYQKEVGTRYYAGQDNGHHFTSTSSKRGPNQSWLLINNNDKFKKVMLYGELMAFIIKDEDQEVPWPYQGPTTVSYEGYNQSLCNIHPPEWENGETTFEQLHPTICSSQEVYLTRKHSLYPIKPNTLREEPSPTLDDSALSDVYGVLQYQSLICPTNGIKAWGEVMSPVLPKADM
jgi:hypothetical protein